LRKSAEKADVRVTQKLGAGLVMLLQSLRGGLDNGVRPVAVVVMPYALFVRATRSSVRLR